MQEPPLKRGLLGYRPKSVRAALEEREQSIAHASLRATTAEKEAQEAAEQAARLQADLKARVDEAEDQAGRLADAQAEIERLRALLDELAPVEERAARQEREILALRPELETVRAQAEALRGELETSREQLESSRAGAEALRAELETSVADAERARAAEEHSARLEAEIDELRRELFTARQALVSGGERLRQAEGRVVELEAVEAERATSTSTRGGPATTEEVRGVLRAAQDAMARLVEAASREAAAKLGETEALHERMKREVERLTVWRDQVTPLVQTLRTSIELARLRTARVGQRIQEAVDPLNEAIVELDRRLSAIAELEAPDVGSPVIELHDVEGEGAPRQPTDPTMGDRR